MFKSQAAGEVGLSFLLVLLSIMTHYRRFPKQLPSSTTNAGLSNGTAVKAEDSSTHLTKDSKANKVSQPQAEKEGEHREPATMDRVLVGLHWALAMTFLQDLGLFVYQAYGRRTLSITPNVLAKALSLMAFTVTGNNLRQTAVNNADRSTYPFYIDHVFGWIALIGFTFEARSFFVHGWGLIASGAFFEKDSKVDLWSFVNWDQDIIEQVQMGTLLIRYALLWIVSMFSALRLSGALDMSDLKVPAALLKSLSSSSSQDNAEPTISASQRDRLKELDEEEKAEAEAFKGFWPKTKLAIRLSYPWGERRLQLLILLKFLLMLIDRAINLLVPIQTERILRGLTQDNFNSSGSSTGMVNISKFDAWSVILYVLYSYLQRYSGVLSIIQRLAWEPVNEFTVTSITIRFFEHVHNMSMQFHIDCKSGELMQTMHRGVAAMQSVSGTVLFRLLPTIADVVIAVMYFWIAWGWKYGAIVSFNSALYLLISAYTTKRRSRFYRQWIEVDDGSHSKAIDSLVNFETVKYFTAESFEVNQYKKSFEKSKGKSFEISIMYEMLDMFETFIWTVNSLAGCMLCAYEISKGNRGIGSFMSFIVYSRQLEGPVDSMAYYFKSLRRDFVSMEKILKLLEQEPTVKDIPNAEPLVVTEGEIVFDDVSFQYNENKKGLTNISFTVPKGKTVAIVGPTGSGKSTLLRLVFRFWDPTSGRILIDGQNIAEKTQLSLREQIGVVPQEAVLFDDSISYNIHYGRVNASKEDIINAAKVAQIHESILKFKDGYDTTVGERGTKLSGGEKQRIALARTILKNPPIILLDEATSALDSATESQIQTALAKMTENRTTLVVAHRLSTIMQADQILVMKDGEIVERGTHAELLRMAAENGGEGDYCKMWKIQQGETANSKASTVAEEDTTSKDKSDDSIDSVQDAPSAGTKIETDIVLPHSALSA